jgi:hypothetical protein
MELQFREAFFLFIKYVEDKNINWALTGSFRLYIEDNSLFKASDIDILTDYTGANLIKQIFDEFIFKKFNYSEVKTIKSYYGQLIINNVIFDVMSNIQNQVNGVWCDIPNLNEISFLKFEGYRIPVLPLLVEYNVSKDLNQEFKSLLIKKIINNSDK